MHKVVYGSLKYKGIKGTIILKVRSCDFLSVCIFSLIPSMDVFEHVCLQLRANSSCSTDISLLPARVSRQLRSARPPDTGAVILYPFTCVLMLPVGVRGGRDRFSQKMNKLSF